MLPLLVLWANVHGSVLVGAGLVALYGATSALRRQTPRPRLLRPAALVLLPWPCVLVSPYGFGLIGYYRHFVSSSALANTVSEWAPSTVRSQPFFFIVLGVVLFVVFRQRHAIGLFAQLAVVCTAIGGLLANRNIVWFALVTAAFVPRALDELWPPGVSERRPRVNLLLALATLVALVGAAGSAAAHSRSWFESSYPRPAADAVARLAARSPGSRVYANGTFADWLLFVHPSLEGRVSSDIRYELLSDRELGRIAAFQSRAGATWPAAADSYRLLVLDPHEPAAVYYRHRGARRIYQDTHVAVLER